MKKNCASSWLFTKNTTCLLGTLSSFLPQLFTICQFWRRQKRIAEESSLPKCESKSLGKQLPTFRRNSLHSSSGLRIQAKVKVKCTLVQALRLCTGRTTDRGSRGKALLFHDHGTRRGWGVSVMPRPLFTPRKDPVPIVQEAGWTPGPVWTGAENLAAPGFDLRTVQPVASRLIFE